MNTLQYIHTKKLEATETYDQGALSNDRLLTLKRLPLPHFSWHKLDKKKGKKENKGGM